MITTETAFELVFQLECIETDLRTALSYARQAREAAGAGQPAQALEATRAAELRIAKILTRTQKLAAD